MKKYIIFVVLSSCIFSVKSHGIKIVILTILGLAGLWLIHLLAQDYQSIQNPAARLLFKRSLNYQKPNYTEKWEAIWAHDPVGCARSFLCQLAASNRRKMNEYEHSILNLVQRSLDDPRSWAMKDLRNSYDVGEKSKDVNECMKMYRFCPFSLKTMMTILKTLKNTF